ncbi:MAG: ribosome maturation factor RimM [Actinomycetes bacterium]
MSDGPETPVLEVGRITKAHGLRGEVVVHLVSDRTERLDPGSVLLSDREDLTVVASRQHGDRWIVQFQGCNTREAAESLRGFALRASALNSELPAGEHWVHELIGVEVAESDGTARGVVVAVQSNPAADLLVLSTGALVPVVFIVDGPTAGRVTVDVPSGLFELFDA